MKKHIVFFSLSALALPIIALILVTIPVRAANGLIGAWGLDEGTGTTAIDSSGNGNHGTIVRGTGTGSPVWVSPGHNASTPNALDFDGSGTTGSASNTVNLGNGSVLDQLDNYTISLWVKFKPGYVGGGGTWANLVGRTSANTDWAWMIYVNSSGTIRPHHRNSNGSFAPLTNSATVMPVNQWVHIEQVADGNKLHLYINGQEDPNFPISYSGTTMSLPSANVYIGQDTRERAPLATISDVKIYNDASLSPQVVTSPASNITHSSATLNGTLTTLGDYTSAQVFFRYRVAGSGNTYTVTSPQTVGTTGPFSANVSGLVGNTQYEFVPVVQWQGRDGTQEIAGQLFTFRTLAYGVNVQVIDSLTGEDGDIGNFRVCLSVQPSAPVTIALSSSNTNEGTVPASITIQPNNWNNCSANLVTVTGVNDSPPAGDGSVPYTIVTGDVTSADSNFNALTGSDVADVSMENQNDDPPGVAMTVLDNSETSEAGGTVRVRFELLSAPSSDVTIPLSLSDTTEGTLSGTNSITITPANWDQPQSNEIIISGVDDDLTDGNVLYTLQTGDPTSSDAGYDALTATDIANATLANVDNDTPGVIVDQSGGSTNIVEGGVTDSFSVVLETQPAPGNSVVVNVQPDMQVDLGNGPGIAIQFTFDNTNWDVPQDVTVTATNDAAIEGSHTGLLVTSIDPSSTESSYLAVDPADVTAHITDNDDDNDGVSATQEDACPNGGDSNNDGTPDSAQPNVTCFVSEVTDDYVVLEINDTCQNTTATMKAETQNAAQDVEYDYPVGLMDFTTNCGTPGFTATVKQFLYGVNKDFAVRKFNTNTNTYSTISSATLAHSTIGGQAVTTATYNVTDGTELDMDGTANGTIVDPAGLALTATSGSNAGAPNTGLQAKSLALYVAVAIIGTVSSGLLARHLIRQYGNRKG